MADKSVFDAINDTNLSISKEIYNNDQKSQKQLNKLESILSSINHTRPSSVNKNILEFYTSIEMNKSKDINSKFGITANKEDLYRQIEDTLKTSMQNVTFDEDKHRAKRYEDYRLIDSYIPELAHCLDLYRDTIMSPDDITKQSLNYIYQSNDNNELNLFNDVIKEIDKKYNLKKTIREETRNGLRDGDLFSIIIPLSQGFNKILKEDEMFIKEDINSSEDENNGIILSERYMDFSKEDFDILLEDVEIKGENETEIKRNKEKKISEIKKEIIDDINKHVKFYQDPLDLISDAKKQENKSNTAIEVNGSFFYIPLPENMIKIELDDICFGYLYFEKNNDRQTSFENGENSFFGNVAAGGLTINSGGVTGASNDVFNSRYDFVNAGHNNDTKYQILSNLFVKGISRKIDKKFVEDNKEFKNIIYSLLRNDYITNQDVQITFLEPEYVCHFKLDSNETYGISKLAKSLFFAKLYLSTLITSVFAKIGKGKDKRAFYVDVGMDDDMEGTINGLIRDIKSKEVTTSTMKNITTILNTVGTYEDFYIPTINGERPFEIDTIPGIQVDINDDFLDFLLKSTIGGTGIPSNYIDATRDVDFARSLAMQNSSFVRSIIGYQGDFGDYWTQVIRKLYRNETQFNNNNKTNNSEKTENKKKKKTIEIDIEKIYINFPTPIYLALSTLNEQISNISQTVDFITELYYGDSSVDDDDRYDEKKLNFRKEVTKRYLATSMDWDMFDGIYKDVNQQSVKNKIEKKIEENSQDDEM